MNGILEQDFNNAVKEVIMVIDRGASMARAHGYGYSNASEGDAPESYKALKASVKDYKCIPIANYGSDSSIYGKQVNTLFRFWYDFIHLQNDLSFSFKDEKKTALIHLELAQSLGISKLAQAILWADTYGQVAYYYRHQEFVNNQRAFVDSCLQHGIKKAVNFKH